MLIDKNIKSIIWGRYNVSEVKYMDKTVWSAGKNITLEIDSDPSIGLIINRQDYSHGTYSLKLDNDENLNVSIGATLPGIEIVRKGNVEYAKTYFVSATITSSDGREVSTHHFGNNDTDEDKRFYKDYIVPFTEFKNEDKLIMMVKILYYLREI